MDKYTHMNTTQLIGRIDLIGFMGMGLSWILEHFNTLTGLLTFIAFYFFYIRERNRKEKILDEKLKQEKLTTEQMEKANNQSEINAKN